MAKKKTAAGKLHALPDDLKDALDCVPGAREIWAGLTPLARNEWICWATSVKRLETRKEHVERVCSEILEGKRRPCCWPGCPHR